MNTPRPVDVKIWLENFDSQSKATAYIIAVFRFLL